MARNRKLIWDSAAPSTYLLKNAPMADSQPQMT
jgi:hypothetical protein